MTLTTKNTKDMSNPWTTWFLYGDNGSGKTTAASTFPKPLFLVPKNEQSQLTLIGKDFQYIEITSVRAPYKGSHGGMDAVLEAILADYRKAPDKFAHDTIVVESLSHYADLALDDLAETHKDTRQLYGALGNHFRAIHAKLRSIDVHVVYTSLAQIEGGKEQGSVQVGTPMISGKTQIKLPAACDVIGFMEQGTGVTPKYKMHLERFKCFFARTRFAAMPKTIENFNFAEMEQYIG